MAFVDTAKNKLLLKVVLTGPPAVGKTSRLDQIGAEGRRQSYGSKLLARTEMAILPMEVEGSNRQVELEIYEWHGPEKVDVRAKALFVGLDGLIYIADSREDRWIDTTKGFEFLLEEAGKSRIQRIPGLLLLGHQDEGLLRLPRFVDELEGPTWCTTLDVGIDEAPPFLEAVKLLGEAMLARVL
ncbi:MAG: hypothetical protein U1E65_16250 [Myxococcota bacterium]